MFIISLAFDFIYHQPGHSYDFQVAARCKHAAINNYIWTAVKKKKNFPNNRESQRLADCQLLCLFSDSPSDAAVSKVRRRRRRMWDISAEQLTTDHPEVAGNWMCVHLFCQGVKGGLLRLGHAPSLTFYTAQSLQYLCATVITVFFVCFFLICVFVCCRFCTVGI